jgi:hypothetical protein
MTTRVHPDRHEVTVLLVIRRRSAARRGDYLFLGWTRIIAQVFSLDAALPRRVWEECFKKAGGTFQVYRDARAAMEPFAEAYHRVSMAAGGAKVLCFSTDAVPLLPVLPKPAA